MSEDFSRHFFELQSDFYKYMVSFGGIAPKTARDYISRLKFLSSSYCIDLSLTKEDIEEIIAREKIKMQSREKYSIPKAMGDFRSGLNKFLSFVNYDYRKKYNIEIKAKIEEIEKSTDLVITEKETIIQSRIGQGSFRKSLIDYWQGCAFSGCDMKDVLIASHIKPWRASKNYERLDCFNGLLLLPNYDKLFDCGYISIDINGKFMISKFLTKENISILHLSEISAINIDERHKPYLEYHNKYCFMG
ncbi:MAG: HNH endonuclease [Defluviitaleaceae bacterium]|nr:HNH endonuclease [Defluviitaleaceae bacterium]